jgi:uncharacterized protein YeaO (DUF488 family)
VDDTDTPIREARIDCMLADSFPASDPPSFTPIVGMGSRGSPGSGRRYGPPDTGSAGPRVYAPGAGPGGGEAPCVVVRRAYDPAEADDGYRVLVDRIWPRGVSRADLRIAEWIREVAPSNELRRSYAHRLERWEEFRQKYGAELEAGEQRSALERLTNRARAGRVTLVVGARDVEHSQGAVLRAAIMERLNAAAPPGKRPGPERR